MELRHFGDGSGLIARAHDFLAEREVMHALITAIAARANPPADEDESRTPYRATIEDNARVVGIAVRTPPHNVLLSYIDPELLDRALDCVIADLRARKTVLPGSGGPLGVADVFAERWARANGNTARLQMSMREFELERVIPAAPVAGELRLATVYDLSLVHDWMHAFIDETGLPAADRAFSTPAMIAQRIADKRFWLWSDRTHVYSLAGSGGTARVARVGPVYTPREWRGRGFASAIVSKLSQRLLDDGSWRVGLSTDLSNPTSNRIYQAVGYRPVGDTVMMAFNPPAP